MSENGYTNKNQPTDEEIIEGIQYATDKKRAQNALLGFGIIFLVGYYGGKIGAASVLRDMKDIRLDIEGLVTAAAQNADAAAYAADRAAYNADVTFHNGGTILKALKDNPVQDAVKALKALRTN